MGSHYPYAVNSLASESTPRAFDHLPAASSSKGPCLRVAQADYKTDIYDARHLLTSATTTATALAVPMGTSHLPETSQTLLPTASPPHSLKLPTPDPSMPPSSATPVPREQPRTPRTYNTTSKRSSPPARPHGRGLGSTSSTRQEPWAARLTPPYLSLRICGRRGSCRQGTSSASSSTAEVLRDSKPPRRLAP